MALPQLPAPDRPHVWQNGRNLAPGEREKRWKIAGFPSYEVDAEGRIWKHSYIDRSGHRRRGREVHRQRKQKGSEGYQLRRNGCPVWFSVDKLRELLRPA